jgi:cardiolipin synthase
MFLLLFIEIVYVLIVIAVIIKIILDTDDSVKATAYVLFVVLFPVAGIIVYFSVGIKL